MISVEKDSKSRFFRSGFSFDIELTFLLCKNVDSIR